MESESRTGIVAGLLATLPGLLSGEGQRAVFMDLNALPRMALERRLFIVTMKTVKQIAASTAASGERVVNPQILINAIVQQTMVLLAHIATAGRTRAPLAQVADRVFLSLTEELRNQGVTKNVIADMFGMALRTYHRRIRAINESQTEAGKSVWEAVLEHIRQNGPISTLLIQKRFRYDDPTVVSSVLNDLSNSGIVYRAGRGSSALFRIADQADFGEEDELSRQDTREHLVWLTVFRHGPVGIAEICTRTGIEEAFCRAALKVLVSDERVTEVRGEDETRYASSRFEVPVGSSQGWEAAVFDHYQALVSAICVKLRSGSSSSRRSDTVGGGTYSLEIWPGHPFEHEALGTLARIRQAVADLRDRIDAFNRTVSKPGTIDEVVFYFGQYTKSDLTTTDRQE